MVNHEKIEISMELILAAKGNPGLVNLAGEEKQSGDLDFSKAAAIKKLNS